MQVIIKTTVAGEPDRRYRILVLLQRSDRERYYTFNCPHCTMPVAELVNTEIIALNDLIDGHTLNNQSVGVRCDGRYAGEKCRWWFFFSLQ